MFMCEDSYIGQPQRYIATGDRQQAGALFSVYRILAYKLKRQNRYRTHKQEFSIHGAGLAQSLTVLSPL